MLSSVYLVSYASLGGPILVAGLRIPAIGLQNMVYGYAAFVVVLSVIALLLLLWSRAKRIKSSTAAAQYPRAIASLGPHRREARQCIGEFP